MAVTRLNYEYRSFLQEYARATVKCPVEEKAFDHAYVAMADVVRKLVQAKYPPRDMKVLGRYELVEHACEVKFNLSAGGVVAFNFRQKNGKWGAQTPMRPRTYEAGRKVFQLDEANTKIYYAYDTARTVFENLLKAKLADYDALIKSATTLEEVEKVWSEASIMRTRIVKNLPAVLSEDVVKRIRADVATRAPAG